jgi:hypothetical protein
VRIMRAHRAAPFAPSVRRFAATAAPCTPTPEGGGPPPREMCAVVGSGEHSVQKMSSRSEFRRPTAVDCDGAESGLSARLVVASFSSWCSVSATVPMREDVFCISSAIAHCGEGESADAGQGARDADDSRVLRAHVSLEVPHRSFYSHLRLLLDCCGYRSRTDQVATSYASVRPMMSLGNKCSYYASGRGLRSPRSMRHFSYKAVATERPEAEDRNHLRLRSVAPLSSNN